MYIVNKNIQRIIREKGLDADKVARAAGISEAVLSNIVRCKRKVYADEVVDLAAALRTSIAELFREPERKKRMQMPSGRSSLRRARTAPKKEKFPDGRISS